MLTEFAQTMMLLSVLVSPDVPELSATAMRKKSPVPSVFGSAKPIDCRSDVFLFTIGIYWLPSRKSDESGILSTER